MFYAIKYFADGYHLLTVFRKETESSGDLLNHGMDSMLYIVLTSQLFFIMNCYLSSGNVSVLITAVMFLFTLLIQLNFSRTVISPDNFPEARSFTHSEEILKEWRRMYSHPLIVKPVQDPKHKPKSMNKRKNFNDDIIDEREEDEDNEVESIKENMIENLKESLKNSQKLSSN